MDVRDYSQYDQCQYCGKYNMPPSRYPIKNDKGQVVYYREDISMVCDGILTLGENPFAAEIHGDYTESYECMGSRHDSAMDI